MKKIIIIASALVFTTGILASQTKVNAPQQKIQVPTIQNTVSSGKELASGD